MKMSPMLVAPLAVALLSACATVPPPVRSDGFAVLHEATRAGPLTVRPDAVREDSRCPMNARCVWAGRVVVDATVSEEGQSMTRTLVLGEPSLTRNGEVMLDSVTPETRTDTPIGAKDYRFHFNYRPRQLD